MDRQEIGALTGLRGIAALCVLGFHVVGWSPAATGFSRGYLAVDLFFVLSGFVLAHVYGEHFSRGITVAGYLSFLWARIARIYPVHLAMLVLLLPLIGARPGLSLHELWYNLALLQGPWLDFLSWNYASWSISAEWHAYLIFPIIVPIMLRGIGPAWRIAGVALLLEALFILKMGSGNVTSSPLMLFRSLPEFLIGIACYRIYIAHIGAAILRSDKLLVLLAIAFVALVMIPYSDPAPIFLLPLILLAAVYNQKRFHAFLNSRPIQYAGRISYSVYMVQSVATILVTPIIPPPFETTAFLATALLGGALVSATIEYPSRRFLRAIGTRRAALAYGSRL
jgi:peptidoglycan/LPS O-acetylase OafA/YrhL